MNAAENYGQAWRAVPECARYHLMRFNALEQGILSIALKSCESSVESIEWSRLQLQKYIGELDRAYPAGKVRPGRQLAAELRRKLDVKEVECVSTVAALVETASSFREYSGLLDIPSQPVSTQDLAALSPGVGSESILLPVPMKSPSETPPPEPTRMIVRSWAFGSFALAAIGTGIATFAEIRKRKIVCWSANCPEIYPAANLQSTGTFLFGFSIGSVTGGLTMLLTGKDRRNAWIAEGVFGTAVLAGGIASTAVAAKIVHDPRVLDKRADIIIQDLGAALLGVGTGLVVSTAVNALVARWRGRRWAARKGR